MKASESTLRLVCVLVAFPLTYTSLILWICLSYFPLLFWSPIQFHVVLLTDLYSSDKNKISRGIHIWEDHMILRIIHFSFASLETNASLSFPQAPESETLLLVRKLYLLRASTSVSLLNVGTVVVEELKWLQSVKMFVPSFCSVLAERQENQDLTEYVLANSFTCCVHLTGILATRFMKCCSVCIYKTQ